MNKTLLQAFQWELEANSNHWQSLVTEIDYFKKLGINALWLPPAAKGSAGVNDVGYGTYDLYDLGEFDQKGSVATKYGTKEEYLTAIKKLQENQIDVYADIVFNHFMGADETEKVSAVKYSWDNRNQQISDEEEIEAWTRFTFPGRKGKYDDYIWSWRNFSGVDYDAHNKDHAIFNLADKGWVSDVDSENGNFDYLMGCNLDMTYEETIEQLDRWGKWFLEQTNVDGFRLDAVKHIQFDFFVDWLLKRRQEKGAPLFVVGEYWTDELDKLENYIDSSGNLIYLFDVPLHFNFYQASRGNGTFDLREIFTGTLVESRPEYAVTFVDNHDTQKGQSLESWVEGWFKVHAYALILLRKIGTPTVFWGDLYGIKTQNIGPVGEKLEYLLKIRQHLAYGNEVDYFDDPDCIGWVFTGDFDKELSGFAVILTDSDANQKEMTISAIHAGKTFVDVLKNNDTHVVLDENGRGLFPVNGGQISVYVNEDVAKKIWAL
ncbi:alpha-amylase [Enterococcus canintestini]|uniref:alpha-amylase n=1 Tax=Enterococcus canintestini TaxID=317010 RepID=UPI00288E01C6|nr:alpha-amylase [Enterococcus canintestini]MDT2740535.1 alpha-amylase [Enterococcus canintestini]